MGYHFYHFYEDDEKLAQVLARFFMEGLRKLEYCMWVPPQNITQDKAIKLLKKHIPDIEDFLLNDQMYIQAFESWYLTEDGRFDIDALKEKWNNKYNEIMEKGFIMMRVAGDVSSLAKTYWDELMKYEAYTNDGISDLNVTGVCTYGGKLYKPTEIHTILEHHFCPLTPGP